MDGTITNIKELEIGGKVYTIGQFSAEVGSSLLRRLMKQLMEAMSTMVFPSGEQPKPSEDVESKSKAARASINLLITNMAEADYISVLKHCLNVVSRYESDDRTIPPIPVTSNGNIVARGLKNDIGAVTALVSETLFVNLSPFFSKKELAYLLTGVHLSDE